MSGPPKDSTAVMARRHREGATTPLLDATVEGGGMAETRELVLRPSGGSAVMAGRQAVQPNGLDYFPTPPWAARRGGEIIKALDPLARSCWEPACGAGHMAFGLGDYFETVLATDIWDHGGDIRSGSLLDFTSPAADAHSADWIVSNPPFKLGEAFIRAAWPRARRGVAMLLRLQFIEGGARHDLFAKGCPLSLLAPFAERVPMVAGHWDHEAGSATAYAWFVFLKPAARAVSPLGAAIEVANAQGCHLSQITPPGAKARLQRHADLVKFGPDTIAHWRARAAALALEAQTATPAKRAAELRAEGLDLRRRARDLEQLIGRPDLFSAQEGTTP